MRRIARFRLSALVLLAFVSGCSTYHGPITNAAEGYHEIGEPTGG